jgi:hypothetical protein
MATKKKTTADLLFDFIQEIQTAQLKGEGNLFEIMKKYPSDMTITDNISVMVNGKGDFLPTKKAPLQLELFGELTSNKS